MPEQDPFYPPKAPSFAQAPPDVPNADELTKCVELDFRVGGNARQFLKMGWSGQDRDFIWTEGYASELAFDAPAPGRYLLWFDAIALGAQRLIVTVNDATLKTLYLDGACSRLLAIEVRGTQSGAPICLRLGTPDANSPKALFGERDTRILGFAFSRLRLMRQDISPRILPPIEAANIETATGLPRATLMHHFESLGHNCELGIVQRLCGAEPMGLLRFSFITLPNLIRGLSTCFEGLGDLEAMSHTFWEDSPDPEYIIQEANYGLIYHSGTTTTQAGQAELYRREAMRLAFYRRKFLEDITEGSKIFVFHSPAALTLQDVMPVFDALKQGILLWVVDTSAHPPGTVEILARRFLRGHIDHFAPLGNVARAVDLPPWLSICANAYRASCDA